MRIPARAAMGVFFSAVVGLVPGARADTSPAAAVPPPFTPTAVTFEAPLARTLPGVGRSLATGDFDGDGTLDAAVLVPGAVAVVLGGGRSREVPPIVTPLGATGAGGADPEGPRVADMDGDGLLDLVISGFLAPSGCGATVLRGLGDGSFEVGGSVLHPPVEGSSVMSCQGVEVADFDDNGSPDIAVLYSYMPADSSNGLNGLVDVFLGRLGEPP